VRGKRELVRLVRTRQGEVEIDITGRMEGRGAYICPRRECLEKAMAGKQLEHALKGRLNPENRERLMIDGQKILKEPSGQDE
jgi:predicted RNA-binding protein YlxR (DUF448 family)